MFLLPPRIRHLLEEKKGKNTRVYSADYKLLSTVEEVASQQVNFGEEIPPDLSIREYWYSLSFREREVLALVYRGYRNHEVADTLGVGYGTIGTHLQNIFNKFGLRSRKELRNALSGWDVENWWTNNHK